MTDLTGVVSRLDRLVDQLERRDDDTVDRYLFGERDLLIHTPAHLVERDVTLGLVPGAASESSVDLYVLTAADVENLRLPSNGVRAAYGAMPESLETHWLMLWEPDTGKLLALDRRRRIALWQPGAVPPPRERAEFCRPLLHWLAVLDGNVIVHAAAVSINGLGILVAGAGNAGKSTLARACLAAGWDVLGDNVVELSPTTEDAFRILPVYPTFKVRPGGVLAIPADWPKPEWDSEAQKDIYFVGDALAPAFRKGASQHVATLVLNETGDARPRAVSRAEAFFRVAPNTVAQFPFFEQEALSRTGSVIAAAPVLSAGRIPVDEIPSAMVGLMARPVDLGVRA